MRRPAGRPFGAGALLSVLIGTVGAPLFSTLFAGVDLNPFGWLAIGIAFLTAFQYSADDLVPGH